MATSKTGYHISLHLSAYRDSHRQRRFQTPCEIPKSLRFLGFPLEPASVIRFINDVLPASGCDGSGAAGPRIRDFWDWGYEILWSLYTPFFGVRQHVLVITLFWRKSCFNFQPRFQDQSWSVKTQQKSPIKSKSPWRHTCNLGNPKKASKEDSLTSLYMAAYCYVMVKICQNVWYIFRSDTYKLRSLQGLKALKSILSYEYYRRWNDDDLKTSQEKTSRSNSCLACPFSPMSLDEYYDTVSSQTLKEFPDKRLYITHLFIVSRKADSPYLTGYPWTLDFKKSATFSGRKWWF